MSIVIFSMWSILIRIHAPALLSSSPSTSDASSLTSQFTKIERVHTNQLLSAVNKQDTQIKNLMLASIPGLRAFAISLCGNVDRADDLVQETLLRAMANINLFKLGTNMKAWLITILRNQYYSEYRKRRREVEDTNGSYSERLSSLPEQEGHLEIAYFRAALAKLPTEQREALILIGGLGNSYEEVASICGCASGTIKSRVHRARLRLSELLSVESPNDFGPDRTMRAVIATNDRI